MRNFPVSMQFVSRPEWRSVLSKPVIIAAMTIGLALCGCDAPAGPESGPKNTSTLAIVEEQLGVQLALLEPSDVSDAAALEGELRVDGKCLYLTQEGTSGGTLLAFLIADARWDAARERLVAHGKSFASGQRVRLGGSSAGNPASLRWRKAPHPSCDIRGVMVVGSVDALP
jgi:hypothetical protein